MAPEPVLDINSCILEAPTVHFIPSLGEQKAIVISFGQFFGTNAEPVLLIVFCCYVEFITFDPMYDTYFMTTVVRCDLETSYVFLLLTCLVDWRSSRVLLFTKGGTYAVPACRTPSAG